MEFLLGIVLGAWIGFIVTIAFDKARKEDNCKCKKK